MGVIKQKILFVINPKSGVRKSKDYTAAISRTSEKYTFHFRIYETKGNDDDKEIQKIINEFNPETVITIGGDGTINLVARIIAGTDISLGIIPAGSANGLAHNLGIPEDFDEALDNILRFHPGKFDVIEINNKYMCLHLSDIGINARIVKRFEEEGAKGLIGYGKQLFKELFESRTNFLTHLEIPGMHPRKYKSEMLIIANAQSFGTGAMVNPSGKYNDGKFEIIIIRPYPWWFVINLLAASFTGRLHKMKYIKVFSVSEADITLSEPRAFQIDGETVPDILSIRIRILPGALKVIGA